jgi:N-acetylneuraminic acid mutarotase
MKISPVIRLSIYLFLLAVLLINNSCQKEFSCENCNNNKPPVSKAGSDQFLVLPLDSVTLDGSASSDPDGTIISYQWTKVSGPSLFNIINPVSPQTKLNGLVAGIYEFELLVTDDGGLSARDTIRVFENPAGSVNIPPVANAGKDTVVVSNQASCTIVPGTIPLSGSLSYDSDGTIISYLWTGPGIISNPFSAITTVSLDVPGVYSFILKVTDNNGASAYDTVQVTTTNMPAARPLVPAQLIPVGTLSESRTWISAGAVGNKIFFAGGISETPVPMGPCRIDILDISTNTWSAVDVHPSRGLISVVTCGNKIFFGGGYYQDGTFAYLSNKVNIYDASNNTWTEATLNSERFGMTAGSVGNKVFFAGGTPNFNLSFLNTVDVYDLISGTWSVNSLSEARAYMAAVTVDDKVYFGGGTSSNGISGRIDIYDNSMSSWSTSNLIQPRSTMTAMAANRKIYWAGGLRHGSNPSQNINTSEVEIKDVITQSTTSTCLFQPNNWWINPQSSVQKNNKLIFFTGTGSSQNMFDIYDTITNSWSIGVLDQDVTSATIISVNNVVYVAGGFINGILSDKVWKLEF